ncbi:MAG: hypothetical protein ACI9G1_002186 [Pirellulaceae bacterium]
MVDKSHLGKKGRLSIDIGKFTAPISPYQFEESRLF